MCFHKTTNHKVSPGITCIKVMYYKDGILRPEFHTRLKYKLGDVIHAHDIPDIKLPFKYRFKKKAFRQDLKKKLAAQHIDDAWYSEFGGEVVHSFSSEKRAEWWSRGEPLVLVECLIPKGEIYWENKDDGQYASFSVEIIRVL
jgi:hypothetical protein